jgi:hypothetical protein
MSEARASDEERFFLSALAEFMNRWGPRLHARFGHTNRTADSEMSELPLVYGFRPPDPPPPLNEDDPSYGFCPPEPPPPLTPPAGNESIWLFDGVPSLSPVDLHSHTRSSGGDSNQLAERSALELRLYGDLLRPTRSEASGRLIEHYAPMLPADARRGRRGAKACLDLAIKDGHCYLQQARDDVRVLDKIRERLRMWHRRRTRGCR